MSIRLTNLITMLLASAASSVFALGANAQTGPTDSQTVPPEPISELFNRAFNNKSGDFFQNRSIPRQINLIFGYSSFPRGSYPEIEITRDAKLINVLYRDLLEQQVSSDPVIRTRDLDNPYDTSLRLNPSYRAEDFLEGSEFIIEGQPLP